MSSPLRPGAMHADGRGRVGVLLLILSESAFFSIFLVAYLFYIGKSLHPPFPADVLKLPLLATLALLSSSVTIVFAVRKLERGDVRRFGIGLFVTFLLGATFIGMTAAEWQELIYAHGLTIRTNLFGTTYFSLVGFHAAHVTIGLGIMALLLLATGRGHVKPVHAARIDLFSWYWHFVDGVWIAVLLVVYGIGVQA